MINEVKSRGSFLRIKSFVDSAVDPMLNLINEFLSFGDQNSSSGRVLIEKYNQFTIWANDFEANSISKIKTLSAQIIGQLRQGVSEFVEDHYSDRSAGKSWEKHVKSKDIDKKCNDLLETLSQDCKLKLQDIARELNNELPLVLNYTIDMSIKMKGIFDSKRAWNWGTAVTSGGLLIAAVIFSSNPIGLAAGAVAIIGGLFSFVFADRETKAQKARKKLSNRLHHNLDIIKKELNYQLLRWFRKELLKKAGVSQFAIDMDEHLLMGGKAEDFLAAKAIDYTKVSDEDLVKNSLKKEYPDFSKEDIDELYLAKYKDIDD